LPNHQSLRTYPKNRKPLFYIQKTAGFLYIKKWTSPIYRIDTWGFRKKEELDMNNESLKQELEKLHAELKKTQPGDQAQREQLQRLIKDVQASLDNPGEYDSVLQTSLTTRLTESIEMFEISHPVLTEQMDKLLEILSSAGI